MRDGALDSPGSKRVYVRRLFATIADRYDLITVLLSFGLDRAWKRRLISLAGPLSGKRALDLACGTGDIAFGLSAEGASVTGLDITFRMVEIASRKKPSRPLPPPPAPRTASPQPLFRASRTAHPAFLVGDMMALPFEDASFDVVSTGYGLRNVPELKGAIAEIRRVLRPGGMLLSLDFDRPPSAIVRAAYLGYLTVVGAALGYILHRDPDTYRYIPRSITRYPGASAVARMMQDDGFTSAECVRVLGGLMAIHVARK